MKILLRTSLGLVLIFLPLVQGDEVVLKNGSTIQGHIVSENPEGVTVETTPGMKVEFGRDEIARINRGLPQPASPTPVASTPTPPSSAQAAPPASIDPAKKGELKKILEQALKNFEKNQMVVWPEIENAVPLQDSEPAKNYKFQKKDGTFDYTDKNPPGDAEKVWGKTASQMTIYQNQYGGTVTSKSTRGTWVRMYYNPQNQSWGVRHPGFYAFKANQDQAAWMVPEVIRLVDSEKSRRANSLWFDFMNAKAGTGNNTSQAVAKLHQVESELRDLCLDAGNKIGLGDLLWKFQQITLAIDEHAETPLSTDQRVAMARERTELVKQALSRL